MILTLCNGAWSLVLIILNEPNLFWFTDITRSYSATDNTEVELLSSTSGLSTKGSIEIRHQSSHKIGNLLMTHQLTILQRVRVHQTLPVPLLMRIVMIQWKIPILKLSNVAMPEDSDTEDISNPTNFEVKWNNV